MANRFNWSLGHEGKGNVYPNGNISTWNVDGMQEPHHMERADQENQDFPTFKFYISPEGGIHDGGLGFENHTPYLDDDVIERIANEGTALHDARDEGLEDDSVEPRVEMPGGGYGHAYNLLNMMSKIGVAKEEGWADFHTELKLPRGVRRQIRQWVDRLDWPEDSEQEDARRYHITILSMDEYDDEFADWAREQIRGKVFSFKTTGMDIFGDEHVVLRVECPEWTDLVLHWQEKADREGLEPRKFDPPKAHITVGKSPEGKWPQGVPDPHIEFDTRMFNINKNSGNFKPSDLGIRTAAMTRNQKLRAIQLAEGETGADTSRILHEFPDGWTIRQPQKAGDTWREGQLMHNCIGEGDGRRPDDPLDFPGIASLRDPDNYPHVSMQYTPNYQGTPYINEVLGHSNTWPKDEHWHRLYDWARSMGGMGYSEPSGYLGDPEDNEYDYQRDIDLLDPQQWQSMQGKVPGYSRPNPQPVHPNQMQLAASAIQPPRLDVPQGSNPALELQQWLQSFPSQAETQPPSIHHTDEAQIAPQTRSPAVSGPHIDPPSHPYQPYNWAEEGFEPSPLDRTAGNLNFMYHIAPKSARDGIEREGLRSVHELRYEEDAPEHTGDDIRRHNEWRIASLETCPNCGSQEGTPCENCGYDELQLGTDYERAKRHWYNTAWDEPGSPRPFPSQPEHWRHDNARDVKYAAQSGCWREI